MPVKGCDLVYFCYSYKQEQKAEAKAAIESAAAAEPAAAESWVLRNLNAVKGRLLTDDIVMPHRQQPLLLHNIGPPLHPRHNHYFTTESNSLAHTPAGGSGALCCWRMVVSILPFSTNVMILHDQSFKLICYIMHLLVSTFFHYVSFHGASFNIIIKKKKDLCPVRTPQNVVYFSIYYLVISESSFIANQGFQSSNVLAP